MVSPDTAALLTALEAALAASNAPEQRAKRERLAAITREAEELSAAITEADRAVTEAELALSRHLTAKHAQTPSAAILSDPGAIAQSKGLDGTPVEDGLLDGSITEDAHGRYEAVNGRWVMISEAA
jgi:hypothetical protein